MWRAARVFERLSPAFVSVTYGAGGSTRDRTIRVVRELARDTTLLSIAHLTAEGHSVAELRSMIGSYADCGISNVLALRGDPQGGVHEEWRKHPEGLEYAVEMVALVRELGDFHIGVASFPEGHPRAIDLDQDTANLVAKLRAGAEYSITQMFFNVDDYLRLRDRVAASDPEPGAKPIIPGLMPITSLRTVQRQVELSGAAIPPDLLARLTAAAGDGPEEDELPADRRGGAAPALLHAELRKGHQRGVDEPGDDRPGVSLSPAVRFPRRRGGSGPGSHTPARR